MARKKSIGADLNIAIVGVVSGSVLNFRKELIKTLVKKGHNVYVLVSDDDNKNDIEMLGVTHVRYFVSRKGTNIFHDLKTCINLYKIFREIKPDIVLSYTIKPVIWGGLAARLYKRTKFLALITGLGYTFEPGGIKKKLLTKVVINLYKCALKNSYAVIFQNEDNLSVFLESNIVVRSQTHVVNGSGVCIERFHMTEIPKDDVIFLTIGRLLGAKGLREFSKAAESVRAKVPGVRFQVLGPSDDGYDAISLEEIKNWTDSGAVEYLGSAKDVRPFIAKASVFVLASYHEGLPRTSLEAMAMGRPLITTNVPGCKSTIHQGKNGFMVEAKNIEQLESAMLAMLELKEQWVEMGLYSRSLVEKKFSVNKVNDEMLKIIFG